MRCSKLWRCGEEKLSGIGVRRHISWCLLEGQVSLWSDKSHLYQDNHLRTAYDHTRGTYKRIFNITRVQKVISLTDNLIALRTSPFYSKALLEKKNGRGAATLLRALVQIRILKHSFCLISSFLVVFKDNLA